MELPSLVPLVWAICCFLSSCSLPLNRLKFEKTQFDRDATTLLCCWSLSSWGCRWLDRSFVGSSRLLLWARGKRIFPHKVLTYILDAHLCLLALHKHTLRRLVVFPWVWATFFALLIFAFYPCLAVHRARLRYLRYQPYHPTLGISEVFTCVSQVFLRLLFIPIFVSFLMVLCIPSSKKWIYGIAPVIFPILSRVDVVFSCRLKIRLSLLSLIRLSFSSNQL